MQDINKNIDDTKDSLFLKIIRFIFAGVYWISALIIVLILGLLIALQVPQSRNFVINKALDIVNESLLAKIEVGDIDFSAFPNIKIHNARLITGNDTLLFSPKIYLEPNIKDLISGNITINNIFLQSPDIKMIKGNDSLWNFSKIAKPTPPDTTTESPNIIIDLKELLIDNAKFDLIDSIALNSGKEIINKDRINYSKLKLRDLSMKLQADFQTNELIGKANIKHLQFYDIESDFTIKKLNLEAELLKNGLNIDKLVLHTNKTDLNLNGKVRGLSLSKPMSNDGINNMQLELNIMPSKAYIRDVEYFANTTLDKNLIVGLSGKAYGTFKELTVENLVLEPENSRLEINTKLYNLTGGGEFRYKGNITGTTIHNNDIKNILNPNIANALPYFEQLNIENLYFDGTTSTLEADVNALSSLGNIKGKVNLVYFPILKYNTNLTFQKINLAKITKDAKMQSNLTGNLKANGIGSNYRKMITDLSLKLYHSEFQEYKLDTLNLTANINNSKLDISNLHIMLPPEYYSDNIKNFYDAYPAIDISGNVNFVDIKNPLYDLNIETKGLNIAKLTKNPESVEYLSSKMHFTGEGFDTKGFYLQGKAEIEDLVLQDKSAMPFMLDLLIDTKNNDNKKIVINSDLANIAMYGDFNLNSLIAFASHQGKLWTELIQSKMEKIKNASYHLEHFTEPMIPATFRLNADIKDLSFVNLFLKDMKVYSNLKIDLLADIQKERANINIDTINIKKLQFESPGTKLNISDINLSASMNVNSDGAEYYIDTLNVNLPQNGLVVYNDMKFIEPLLSITMDNNDIEYRLGLNIDNTIYFVNRGNINFYNEYLAITSDLLNFKYKDILNLSNDDTLDIRYNDGNIHIQNMKIRDQYESRVMATGDIINGVFNNMQVKISNMKLASVDSVLSKFANFKIDKVKGEIENLSIVANGELKNPRYDISMNTSNININNQEAGKLNLDFKYNDKNISGAGTIVGANQSQKLLHFVVNSFPIDLSIGDSLKTKPTKPIDFSLNTDSLPLSIVSPFVPAVTDMRGIVNLTLDAKGKDFKSLDYKGNLYIPYSSFTLDVNNLKYSATAKVDFNREKITISNTTIRNDFNDLPYGSAGINGEIQMNGFEMLGYEFSLNSGGIMVLGNVSAKVFPSIYGKLVIATGLQPINVRGSSSNLNVNGDVNIINGTLTMPKIISSNSIESKMQYKVASLLENDEIVYNVIDNSTGDTLFTEMNNGQNKIINPIDTNNQEYKYIPKTNIGNNTYINMNFKVLNPITLRVDLGDLGKLTAKIGTGNQYYPLSLNFSPSNGISLLGDIKLLSGSKLSYIKQFDTEGSISFPLGTVANPKLNLKAVYNGKSYIQEIMREFKVFMYITGFLKVPSIRFDYEFEGEQSKGDSTQVFQDALSLVLFGRTKTEMEAGMKASSTEYGSLGIGMLTNQFSDFLSSALQGTGSIESVAIDMGTGNRWEDARLRATGRLFDRIGWRYGSDLNDLSQNSEFSLEIPMNIVLDSNYLNNIVWQFSTSSNIQQTALNRNQKDWEIKLRFGGNW